MTNSKTRPRITRIFLAAATTLLLITAISHAQTPGVREPPATSKITTEDHPTFSAAEKRRLLDWLRQRTQRYDEILNELAEFVGSGETLRAYDLLKELHHGAVGVEGSQYELLKLRAEEEEKGLAILLTERDLYSKMNTDVSLLAEESREELTRYVGELDQRIRKREKKINRLEAEALRHATQAVVKDVATVFDILGRPKPLQSRGS